MSKVTIVITDELKTNGGTLLSADAEYEGGLDFKHASHKVAATIMQALSEKYHLVDGNRTQ